MFFWRRFCEMLKWAICRGEACLAPTHVTQIIVGAGFKPAPTRETHGRGRPRERNWAAERIPFVM